jgi:hypothetical protein
MLYILRLSNGDCILATGDSDYSARESAAKLCGDDAAQIASLRPLEKLAIRLSPNEEGSLELAHWDDATLDGILASEYPLLNEAFRRANAVPFVQMPNPQEPVLTQLKAAYERNTDIIRQGLQQEQRRFAQVASAGSNTGVKS